MLSFFMVIFGLCYVLFTPVARANSSGALCARLFRTAEALRPAAGDYPLPKVLIAIDEARVKGSAGLFSADLAAYKNLRSMTLAESAPASAHQYRALFRRAALAGQDGTLASSHHAIDQLQHAIGDAFFFGAFGGFGEHTAGVDGALAKLESSWARLDPHVRDEFLIWSGRQVAQTLIEKQEYRVRLDKRDEHGQPVVEMNPAFPLARRNFEMVFNAHGDPSEARNREAYRAIGGRLMDLYGVTDEAGAYGAFEDLVEMVIKPARAPARLKTVSF